MNCPKCGSPVIIKDFIRDEYECSNCGWDNYKNRLLSPEKPKSAPKPKEKEKTYTPIDYQCEAMRTADPNLDDEKSLLEGLIGLNSEAGEALDIYKKHIFQNHDLDREKIALELGDALWYLTEAADAISYTLTDIMKMNIEKLQQRYPDGFDPERSRNREV